MCKTATLGPYQTVYRGIVLAGFPKSQRFNPLLSVDSDSKGAPYDFMDCGIDVQRVNVDSQSMVVRVAHGQKVTGS